MDEVKVESVQSEKKQSKFIAILKKLVDYLKRNIKTNTATVTNVLSSFASGSVVGGGLYIGGVAIPAWSYFVIGGAITVIMFFITELGVRGAGPETAEQYEKRTTAEKELKAIRAAEKQEKVAAAAAEKIAADEAKKLQAILDKAEKEKAEADRLAAEKAARDKALESIHKYQDAVKTGYTGTLAQWLSEKK
ncbi:hypothetical protein EOM82_09670 [bacterium]|nr:hypothetical protein [bacterium]